MAAGYKLHYTKEQKRQAKRIEKGYEARGVRKSVAKGWRAPRRGGRAERACGSSRR